MVKRVTIPFPDDLHGAIRLKAESENRSFVKQIQEAAKRNALEPDVQADWEYLATCLDVHADKFPVPSHIRNYLEPLRALARSRVSG